MFGALVVNDNDENALGLTCSSAERLIDYARTNFYLFFGCGLHALSGPCIFTEEAPVQGSQVNTFQNLSRFDVFCILHRSVYRFMGLCKYGR